MSSSDSSSSSTLPTSDAPVSSDVAPPSSPPAAAVVDKKKRKQRRGFKTSSPLIFQEAKFARFIRENTDGRDMRFSKEARHMIQVIAEKRVSEILSTACGLAQHCERKTLDTNHVSAARKLSLHSAPVQKAQSDQPLPLLLPSSSAPIETSA